MQSSVQFSSIDNLANDYSHEKQQQQQQQSQQDLKANQQYQYYLSQNQNTDSDLNSYNSKLDNNISKSIDSIYSPTTTTSTKSNTMNSNGAFNPTKKNNPLEITEELSTSFQPVNFTNNRPKQLNIIQQQSQQSIQQLQALNQQIQQQQQQQQQQSSFIVKGTNFKRDIIAEKKRSSIGKYPQTYTVSFSSNLKLVYFENKIQTTR
jgi:hypothetical protein